MTNKESIQQKHLEAINENVKATCDTGVKNFIATGTNLAATYCTSITVEAIKNYENWKKKLDYRDTCLAPSVFLKEFFIAHLDEWIEEDRLLELFFNLKNKN